MELLRGPSKKSSQKGVSNESGSCDQPRYTSFKIQKKIVFIKTFMSPTFVSSPSLFCMPRRWMLQKNKAHLSRVRLGRGRNDSLQASKQQNTRSKIDVTAGRTDRRTDGLTDIASYRVACTRLIKDLRQKKMGVDELQIWIFKRNKRK